MEHIGDKVYLAIAQQPFERVGDSGFANNFATLVPLLTPEGEVLEKTDFPNFGLVFWMVRQHALRFAEPGRLIVGKLEHAVNPGRLVYQLAPDSAEVPSDLVEVLDVEHPDVAQVRDLVNVESVVTLDHPPTSLVLARWGSNVYGPFRAEIRAAEPGRGQWLINLRTLRADQTVYRIPESDLKVPDKLGEHYISDLSARIAYDSRFDYWDESNSAVTHICRYNLLLGSGFKKLPTLGYAALSVETDRELLVRYAKRFLSRKDIQRLKELLPMVDRVLDTRGDTAGDAERLVFEAVSKRSEELETELSQLSRSLVESGLIDNQIAVAVDLKVQEHIGQQAATLSADIAARISKVRAELDVLERHRDSMAEEIESKRRQTEREIEQSRTEIETLRAVEQAAIERAKRELEQQRDTLSKHLEAVIAKYQTARADVINQFVLLAPFFQRAGFSSAATPAPKEGASGQNLIDKQQIAFPSFVLATDEVRPEPLTEMEFFSRFEGHVKSCGYSYRRVDLASFHLSVKCCDITVLGGLSGTGKSTLPLLYAEALAGQSSISPPGRYLSVGVSPAWLDMRDLLGHVNSLDQRFEPSESGLFRQMINAHQEWIRQQQNSGIYVVVLDEMNLSHVEHYFSGFMQALEHNREIRCFDVGSVSPQSTFASYAKLLIPRTARFIGTVNFDETTKQLSLRLLDRTNLIRLRPQQSTMLPTVTDQRPTVIGVPVRSHHLREWKKVAAVDRDVATVWDRIQTYLGILGAPITPRRRRAIEEFLASTPPELLSPMQAFDLQISQRLLTQVRGLYRPGAQSALDELERALTHHAFEFPEAIAAITELRQIEQIDLPIGDVSGF